MNIYLDVLSVALNARRGWYLLSKYTTPSNGEH